MLLTLAAPAWAGDDKESAYERVIRTGIIRCGYFVWPPFLAIDPNTNKKSGIFFDIVEEILFKLKRLHKKLIIKELPFTFKKRMFGETKRNLVFFILSYIVTLVRLRFSK